MSCNIHWVGASEGAAAAAASAVWLSAEDCLGPSLLFCCVCVAGFTLPFAMKAVIEANNPPEIKQPPTVKEVGNCSVFTAHIVRLQCRLLLRAALPLATRQDPCSDQQQTNMLAAVQPSQPTCSCPPCCASQPSADDTPIAILI